MERVQAERVRVERVLPQQVAEMCCTRRPLVAALVARAAVGMEARGDEADVESNVESRTSTDGRVGIAPQRTVHGACRMYTHSTQTHAARREVFWATLLCRA